MVKIIVAKKYIILVLLTFGTVHTPVRLLYLVQYQSKKCFRKVLPWYGSTDGTTFNSTITLLKVPKVYYNSSDADCSYYTVVTVVMGKHCSTPWYCGVLLLVAASSTLQHVCLVRSLPCLAYTVNHHRARGTP